MPKKPIKRKRPRSVFRMPPLGEIVDIKAADQVKMRQEISVRIEEMKTRLGLSQLFAGRATAFAAMFSGIHLEEELLADCDTIELRRLALSGHEQAIGFLIRLSEALIETLNLIAVSKPESLRPAASINYRWPLLYSSVPLLAKKNIAILREIRFAEKTEWISEQAVMTKDSVTKRFALILINYIQALQRADREMAFAKTQQGTASTTPQEGKVYAQKNPGYDFDSLAARFSPDWPMDHQRYTIALLEQCRCLPPFSNEVETVDQWWTVAYQLLMLNTDSRPEKAFDDLYEVGANRQWHYSGLKDQETDEGYNKDSVKSNIRAKVLTDLKEEFRRFANQLAQGRTDLDAEFRRRFAKELAEMRQVTDS